jgi:eukaryotic-like serine/threonine-protein kinase
MAPLGREPGCTDSDWIRIKAVFGDAVLLDPGERLSYVAKVCGDDAALRRNVERLLWGHERASSFLETPPSIPPDPAPENEMIGRAIGAYVVRSHLGSGGMGTVYLAERADDAFEHHVAIKFVGSSVQSPVLLQRFKDERRILASLDHPNIARLIDGGTTADGIPYVVMEYVQGAPIDRHCRDRGLAIRDRIELFRQVCAAVSYAHQRLVVHRDIKAGNILVSPTGSPKLLDFGIAKLLDPSLGPDAPQVTLLGALSLESASPEQVRGDAITVTSDVYALGALLYRLLTDQGPYGDTPATTAEWQRAICDVMPVAPGEVVRTRKVSDAIPRKPRIDRDLDVITLNALRKEPDRRYSSVVELSDDLGRYLAGKPVHAAPDSTTYRAGKFLRRHAVAAALAATVAVTIIGGAAVAFWEAGVATKERARAERRFEDVRRLANSFLFEFHDTIAELPGSLAARQLVVKRAEEYLDDLAQEADGEVSLQRDLATAYERLATILGGGGVSSLGDLKGAGAHYRHALAIREKLKDRPDADAADSEALAQLRVQLARYNVLTGDLSQAERDATDAVFLLKNANAEASTRTRAGQLATAFHQLGFVQARRDEDSAALQSFEQAMGLARGQVAAEPTNALELARLARIASDYGEQLRLAGKSKDALDVLREGQRTIEALLLTEPLNVRYRQTLMSLLSQQADPLGDVGDLRGSVDVSTRAVAIGEALRAEAPNDFAGDIGVIMSRFQLGKGLVRAGEIRAGTATLRQVIVEAETVAKRAPDNGFVMNQLAIARLALAEALLSNNLRGPEACREMAEGLRVWDTLEARNALPADSGKSRSGLEALARKCERH